MGGNNSRDQGNEQPDPDPPVQLPRWVRILALLLGTGGGVAGIWTTLYSANQAGSAMLFLVSLALLLMGLQGTPILRIGTQDASLELAKTQNRVRREVENVEEQAGPEAAGLVEESIARIDPRLVGETSSLYGHSAFEMTVLRLLRRHTGKPVEYCDGPDDRGVDMICYTPKGLKIGVSVSYFSRAFTRSTLWRTTAALVDREDLDGFLLVTREPGTVTAEEEARIIGQLPIKIARGLDISKRIREKIQAFDDEQDH